MMDIKEKILAAYNIYCEEEFQQEELTTMEEFNIDNIGVMFTTFLPEEVAGSIEELEGIKNPSEEYGVQFSTVRIEDCWYFTQELECSDHSTILARIGDINDLLEWWKDTPPEGWATGELNIDAFLDDVRTYERLQED